jgi:hypothetical protein
VDRQVHQRDQTPIIERRYADMQTTTSTDSLPVSSGVPWDRRWSAFAEGKYIRHFRGEYRVTEGIEYCLLILADVRVWDPDVNVRDIFTAARDELKILRKLSTDGNFDRLCDESMRSVDNMRKGLRLAA